MDYNRWRKEGKKLISRLESGDPVYFSDSDCHVEEDGTRYIMKAIGYNPTENYIDWSYDEYVHKKRQSGEGVVRVDIRVTLGYFSPSSSKFKEAYLYIRFDENFKYATEEEIEAFEAHKTMLEML